MNKSIKTILIIAGVCLLWYGIYTLVVPQTIISICSLDVKAKDNNNTSYITIGLGLLALFIGLRGSSKS
jgi:hypothetical protein